MRQHRALGDAGGAAGVLQKRNVAVAQRHFAQRQMAAAAHGGIEFDDAINLPVGHHFLDLPDHEIGQQFFGPGQHVAHFGGDDCRLQGRVCRQHCLQRVGKVFKHHNSRRARVAELMLQLGAGVLRVDIHHHHAGPQNAVCVRYRSTHRVKNMRGVMCGRRSKRKRAYHGHLPFEGFLHTAIEPDADLIAHAHALDVALLHAELQLQCVGAAQT